MLKAVEAAIKALRAPSRLHAGDGHSAASRAVAADLHKRHGVEVSADRVMICPAVRRPCSCRS
jgi:hypothetical protein